MGTGKHMPTIFEQAILKRLFFSLNIFLFLFLLISPVTALKAAKLEKKECAMLREQAKSLADHPSVKAMEKGYKWVKENISDEDMEPIRQYMEISELLKFRCAGNHKYALPETQVPVIVEILLPIKKPEGSDEKNQPPKVSATPKPAGKKDPKQQDKKKNKKKSALDPVNTPSELPLFDKLFASQ